jgi:hypothetical protein
MHSNNIFAIHQLCLLLCLQGGKQEAGAEVDALTNCGAPAKPLLNAICSNFQR